MKHTKISPSFHLQLYASSPAPKRDYNGLTITSTHAILNSWDISRGPHVYPRRRQMVLEDIDRDRTFKNEISLLFGEHVIDYMERLVKEDKDLFCLPEIVFRKIVRLLALNDILHLRQTSKMFFELCNTNAVWKMIFIKSMKRSPTKQELLQSDTMTWKHMLHRFKLEKLGRKAAFNSFKRGLATLNQQNSKFAETLRQNLPTTVTLHRPLPNDDKFNNKFTIRTFKPEDSNEFDKKPNDDSNKIRNSSKSEINIKAKLSQTEFKAKSVITLTEKTQKNKTVKQNVCSKTTSRKK